MYFHQQVYRTLHPEVAAAIGGLVLPLIENKYRGETVEMKPDSITEPGSSIQLLPHSREDGIV